MHRQGSRYIKTRRLLYRVVSVGSEWRGDASTFNISRGIRKFASHPTVLKTMGGCRLGRRKNLSHCTNCTKPCIPRHVTRVHTDIFTASRCVVPQEKTYAREARNKNCEHRCRVVQRCNTLQVSAVESYNPGNAPLTPNFINILPNSIRTSRGLLWGGERGRFVQNRNAFLQSRLPAGFTSIANVAHALLHCPPPGLEGGPIRATLRPVGSSGDGHTRKPVTEKT